MPHVEILFSQMQSRQINSMFARSCVTHFENEIKQIRNKIGVVEQQSNSSGLVIEPQTQQLQNELEGEAKEVCDVVMMQRRERFKFTGHLMASRLHDPSNYLMFSETFPQQLLNETVQFYLTSAEKSLKPSS